MHFSTHHELQLLILLATLGALLVVAARWRKPLPVLLVAGGVAIGFVPGLPELELPPDLVLVAILPPLLYAAAFFTGLRDLRSNIKPISLLGFGLVAATTCAVAFVAHETTSLSWASAFVLGAIVSPTDALAATEVVRRVGAPRRIVAIIEGESLVNDGLALVLYRAAVVAAVTGAFSLWHESWRIVVNVVGGVAVGLAVGVIVREVRRRINDTPTEVALALLSGFLAYLPAEILGVSGVLAAVTIGVFMGWFTPELTTTETRLSGRAFWEIFVFVVNALLFALVGLQLRAIAGRLDLTAELAGQTLAVIVVVVLVRLLTVPLAVLLPRSAFPLRWLVVIGWAGTRGAVSLAAALALPTDLPGRDFIVFVTFTVILATLVGQGLTLGPLIRRLGVEDDGGAEREDAKARLKAAHAALERLDELAAEEWVRDDTAERLRGAYRFRANRFRARYDGNGGDGVEERSAAFQRLRRELLDAERRAVLALRNEGVITEEVMHRVQRDIDLEDSRLDT